MFDDKHNLKNAKLLVVDDKVDNLQILGLMFSKYSTDLMFAKSGEEALALVKHRMPDLILLDVMMPKMDGFEVCRRLKSDAKLKHIPVVFLTAKTENEDIVEGFRAGGVDYITKPFCKEEIVARVNTHLEIGALHASLKKSLDDAVAKQDALKQDLKIAAGIQKSLLPSKDIEIPGIHASWIYKPSASVGGDLFNIVPLINSYVAFYMLDVSGHGVPSSLIAVTVAQHLLPHTGNLLIRKEGRVMMVSPSDVLANLDKQFPYERFGKFFTIFYGILNIESGALTYSVAGHPAGLLQREDGTIEKLSAGGTVIGAGIGKYAEETVDVKPNDRLLLYTDGVVETENTESELFGLNRLKGCMEQRKKVSSDELLAYINKVLYSYSDGKEPEDDISMMLIEYCPRSTDADMCLYAGADLRAHIL